mgnify:CR=1 FL=1
MADKSVSDLRNASQFKQQDALVVFQDGETKKISGEAISDFIETEAQPYVDDAAESAQAAENDALKSEGYANGTQNGVPVSDTSPYYLHNAQLYVTQARTARNGAEYAKEDVLLLKKSAEAYAVGTINGEPVPSSSVQYHNNAKYYAEEVASPAASNTSVNALKAEGLSVGEQNGEEVEEGSEYWHNNSRYYATQAADAASRLADYTDMAHRAYNAYAKRIVSGKTVHFTDGAEDIPVDDLTIRFTPELSSSNTPIPTNPVTISGATSVTVLVKDEDSVVQAEHLIPFVHDGTTYTVYYGSLNTVTGVLTITHKIRTFTGNEVWNITGRLIFSTAVVNGTISGNTNSIQSTGFCSHYNLRTDISSSVFYTTDNTIVYAHSSIGGSGTFIQDRRFHDNTLYPSSEDKLNAFKNFLREENNQGHPIQLVYRLQTPVVVNLTPVEITTLLGTNIITTDAGTITNLRYSVSPNIQYSMVEAMEQGMRISGSQSISIPDGVEYANITDLHVEFAPTLTEDDVSGTGSFTITRADGEEQKLLTFTLPVSDEHGNTVYGGYYDGNTGYVYITHKKIVYNGSESWNQSSLQNRYFYYIASPSDSVPASIGAEDSDGWTNTLYNLVYDVNSSVFIGEDYNVAYKMQSVFTNAVAVCMSSCSTVDAFKAILAEHPLSLVYRLANPTSVYVGKLDNNITTLGGTNIFTNSASKFSFSYSATAGIKVVIPQTFGAVGDGVADDTIAFQNALNTGCDLFVPTARNEIYKITDTLVVKKSGQRIFGDAQFRGGGLSSGGHIRFDFTDDTGTATEKQSKPLFRLYTVTSSGKVNYPQMVHFCNLKFSTEPHSKHYGTLIDTSLGSADKDIRIDNCMVVYFYKVVDFTGRGFELMNSAVVSGDYIGTFNWDDGEYKDGKGNTAGTETNNNNMPYYGQRAITITGNRLHALSGGVEIVSGHAYGLTIRGNTMDHGHGFVVIAHDEAWNWDINGNVFNSLYKTTGQAAPIYFMAGAKHCNISGNVITSPDDYWSETTYNKTDKKNYWNLRTATYSVDTLLKCVGPYSNGVISSNVFYNSEYSCITLDTIPGTVISCNVFHNPGNKTDTPYAGAISLNGTSERASITGNTFIFTETRYGVNPNVTFILAASRTKLNNSAVFANAHGAADSGMAEILSGSTNLKTDEIA